jgi:hypothetical protein
MNERVKQSILDMTAALLVKNITPQTTNKQVKRLFKRFVQHAQIFHACASIWSQKVDELTEQQSSLAIKIELPPNYNKKVN